MLRPQVSGLSLGWMPHETNLTRRPRGQQARPRLHGHVRLLRRRRERRRGVGPHHPPRPRARHRLHRHRRDVRAVHQRGTGRTGDRRPARRVRRRLEVRDPLPPPRRRTPDRRLTREPPHRDRGLAEAARDRPRRHLLPAPRRPRDADRGDGRRPRRARRRGQDPPHRALRGRAGDDPPRPRDPPDHGAAVGVLALDPRSGGGDPAAAAGARDRVRRLLAARARVPGRPLPRPRRARGRGGFPLLQPPLHRGQLRGQPADPRRGRGRRRGAGGDARPRSRSPGSWPRATTSPRFPAPSGSTGSRRTRRPTRSC